MLSDTEMCHQGSECREKLHPTVSLEFCCFLRVPRLVAGFLYLSNLVGLFLVFQSNRWLLAILMYTLTNHGRLYLMWKCFKLMIRKFMFQTNDSKVLIHLTCYLFRGHIPLTKLIFRMFTQFHNFMEVCPVELELFAHIQNFSPKKFSTKCFHSTYDIKIVLIFSDQFIKLCMIISWN